MRRRRVAYGSTVLGDARGQGPNLDSFAYRRRDLRDRLRVFAVDHPATQSWKRQRLAAIGVDLPIGLVYAPVDFEIQTLRDGLAAVGFGFSQPAVFSWLGTVSNAGCDQRHPRHDHGLPCGQPGSDHVQTAAERYPGWAAQVSAAFVGIATEMGEPFISRFLPDEIDQLLRRHGFGETAEFGPEDARVRYFAGRTEVEVGGAERIITATVMQSG
jgi:methyltransferase (TIGR00027 family)